MFCKKHLGQIKIPVFRVTQPYLSLQVNPRVFHVFWKKYNFMHFAKRNAFSKCMKLLFFPQIIIFLLPKRARKTRFAQEYMGDFPANTDSFLHPYERSVLFVGHMQTVQTQIRHGCQWFWFYKAMLVMIPVFYQLNP